MRPDSIPEDLTAAALPEKTSRNQAAKRSNHKPAKLNNTANVNARTANMENNELNLELHSISEVVNSSEIQEVIQQEFPLLLSRKAIKANSKDDGWANLSGIGSYILRVQPDFDQRDYGYDKLGDLVKAKSNLFDTEEREVPNSFSKQIWVRMHKKTKPA